MGFKHDRGAGAAADGLSILVSHLITSKKKKHRIEHDVFIYPALGTFLHNYSNNVVQKKDNCYVKKKYVFVKKITRNNIFLYYKKQPKNNG